MIMFKNQSYLEVENMTILTSRVLTNLTKNALYGAHSKASRALCATTLPSKAQNYSTESKQRQNLLKFPALKLEETLPKFLKSIEPHLTKEELAETKRITEEFQQKDGAELQKILEKVAASEENWLAHRWLKAAYLTYRDPVTVFSSPGMTFPMQEFKSPEDYFMYTAKLIQGLVKYKKVVDEGKVPVVKMRKNELDNSQFSAVYGTCRIPLPQQDALEYHPKSQHIAVIYKNHFFKLPVYDKNGKILNAKVLSQQLQQIANSEKQNGLPIGLLSTDSRDNWAAAYAELMKSSQNAQSVKAIQQSLFTVSLDENVPFNKDSVYNVLGLQLIHGGGSSKNSANRWMDKTIQVVVNPNGMSGFCYEHSPAEGQPIAMMTDYINKIFPDPKEFEDGSNDNYEPFSKLNFDKPSETLQQQINEASKNVNKLAEDLQLEVLQYKGYGKDFLKKQKLSPDSFVQMALQYAFYKLHQCAGAQYETAHLRIYYGGRTETIRSCSNESMAFAKSMMDAKCSDELRVDLLRKAVNAHREYTTMALQGQGVDRHLLGLKLMALENNKPIPKFYQSPGFVKSAHYRVSTSQVASPNEAFMCYGPLTHDGYGCCYNPRNSDIFLACSAWKSNDQTCAKRFAKAISEALTSMRDLLERAGEKPKSKL
ncbi:LOW QUALITY PROTEIN: carnitine O-acetyltransferase-like [Lucilia sericata]|uniref:LOW QUALITY PROTEIN: carnitine O-acetyltransferase-like n=1 Tax=Lucilia sericata TaxID=13632 RepID=UPI0018A8158C|nr:LOW QUALITY PROTEIN: carnitine O-acetyltransferase-like [Lucilia sericata]